jgi:hypothetical protein
MYTALGSAQGGNAPHTAFVGQALIIARLAEIDAATYLNCGPLFHIATFFTLG